MTEILILFYSKNGSTEALAREISLGADSVKGVSSKLRTVPPVSASYEASGENVPENGPPYIEKQDLFDCDGLIMGSPCRFGNMSAELKYFIDTTSNEWLNNALSDKPAGLFTSSSSLHGGQESTLLTMAIPLLHHGMLITGIPFSEKELSSTTFSVSFIVDAFFGHRQTQRLALFLTHWYAGGIYFSNYNCRVLSFLFSKKTIF